MNQQTEISRAAPRRIALADGLSCLPDSLADVVNHPRMSLDEKRALLASWASDAYAVEDQPTLRKLDTGRIIPVEDILCSLKALDRGGWRGESPSRRVISWHTAFDRRGSFLKGWRRRGRFSIDDDDDPPPCPAPVAPRLPRGGQSGACVVGDLEPVYA